METGVLSVKNMVCHRCILAVESLLDKLAIPYQQVIAGEVILVRKLIPEESDQFAAQLSKIGLELINTKANGTIEKIKNLVIKKARGEISGYEQKVKLSTYLSEHLFHEYTYLSSYFSSVEGRTIESYFIQQRIEKVKELLLYNEMTLSEIAYEMGYSSVAHLSYQFKQITGVTPSEFKKSDSNQRRLLDKI